MNIDAKFLNKILTESNNTEKDHTLHPSEIHPKLTKMAQQMRNQPTDKIKTKTRDHHLLDAEKAFDKIQYPFMTFF